MHHSELLIEQAIACQQRAKALNFDWPDEYGVADKVMEELRELLAAKDEGKDRQIEELGDLLLVVIYLGNYLKLPVNDALRGAIEKFNQRLTHMLEQAGSESLFKALSLEEKERLWQGIKKNEI